MILTQRNKQDLKKQLLMIARKHDLYLQLGASIW